MALDQAGRSPLGASPPLASIRSFDDTLYVTRRRSVASYWRHQITTSQKLPVYLCPIVVSPDHGSLGPLNHELLHHPSIDHTFTLASHESIPLLILAIILLCLNCLGIRPQTTDTQTMRQVPSRKGDGRSTTSSRNIFVALALASQLPTANAIVFPSTHPNYKTDYLSLNKRYNPARRGPPEDWNGRIPLKITNTCSEPIWPGITTQHGVGPGTGGFELAAGESRDLWVGPTWQGRAWGRTNCTVNGESAGCTTGDCFGKLNCEFSGAVPATLAEFNLAGGVSGRQTFYDISLVDGYNIPVGINYIPADNTSYIPPNLTNCACIATAGLLSNTAASGTVYTNSTYPVPWEPTETNNSARDWCPWPLLSMPPEKPGDGVYPYPDDNIMRPDFSPCKSQCAATNSDKDCCIGSWHDPNKCKPGLYSKHAKSICPDAYSFAFDDQTSTFIIPSGGGWEVVFCPAGRSTNILRTMGPQLFELASAGYLSQKNLDLVKNLSYIESQSEKNAAPGVASKSAWAVCAAAVTALLMAI